MKNTMKFLGIIAIVAIIGVTFAACDELLVPSAPSGLYARATSSSNIDLTWYSVSGATGYYVYSSGSRYGSYTRIGSVTSTYASNYNLPSSTTRYYRVTAYNSYGESDYSNTDYATTYSSYYNVQPDPDF